MPLLDIKQVRKVTVTCSLEESTAIQVDQYAAFVKCLPDEVVNKALEYTFGKDSDFQKFRSTEPKVTPQLRIKRPATAAYRSTARAEAWQPRSGSLKGIHAMGWRPSHGVTHGVTEQQQQAATATAEATTRATATEMCFAHGEG